MTSKKTTPKSTETTQKKSVQAHSEVEQQEASSADAKVSSASNESKADNSDKKSTTQNNKPAKASATKSRTSKSSASKTSASKASASKASASKASESKAATTKKSTSTPKDNEEKIVADSKTTSATQRTEDVSINKATKHSQDETKNSEPARFRAAETKVSQPEVQRVTEKQSSNGIAWFAVLLGLGGLGLAAYTYMNSQVSSSKNEGALTRLDDFSNQAVELRQANDAAQSSLSELKGQVSGYGARFDSIDAKLDDMSKSIAATQDSVDKVTAEGQTRLDEMQTGMDERFANQVTKLEEDYGRISSATSAFELKEVESLVNMAQERLVLADDVNSAARALKVADQKLGEIGDSNLLPVRQQVQASIAELEQAEIPDVSDIVTRLAGATQSIDSLPLAEMGRLNPTASSVAAESAKTEEKPLPAQSETSESNQESASDASGEVAPSNNAAETDAPAEESNEWWKSLDGVVSSVGNAAKKAGDAIAESLDDVVVVHDLSETATPLMEPQQRYFLKENLKMAVQNTEYALIRGYGDAAKASAMSAQDILSKYYVGDDKQVQSLNALLDEVATINLEPTIPDISATVEAVRAVTNQ